MQIAIKKEKLIVNAQDISFDDFFWKEDELYIRIGTSLGIVDVKNTDIIAFRFSDNKIVLIDVCRTVQKCNRKIEITEQVPF